MRNKIGLLEFVSNYNKVCFIKVCNVAFNDELGIIL